MNANPVFGTLGRRSLLKTGGALVVGFSLPGGISLAQEPGATKPALTPDQLDSWVQIAADGNVTAFFGKMDMGQGVDVAIGQIVADELDVAMARVTVVMGDTALTCNQGGASGSTGVQRGGVPLRNAAAEARRVLVDMAAEKLGVAVDQLTVADGVVSGGGKSTTYGELIGGRYFNVALEWNGNFGNGLVAKGVATPKTPDQYKIVGTSVPRADIPGKSFGTLDFVTDIKVEGMMHARLIRPKVAGASPQSADPGSIGDIPGVQIVHQGDLLAVVAETEWDAIRASEQLAVTWAEPAAPPFPAQAKLYEHLKAAPAVGGEVEVEEGDVDGAFAGAARVIEAEYQWPFQSHASMGPACAVADVRDGAVTIWTGSQKPHYTRDGVAAILGVPPETVHGIWVPGPGSYGRNDAGDAAMEAAVLSKAVGRPVRVQGMRYEGHAWDPKGPPSVHMARAALDADNNMIGYSFHSKALSRQDVNSNESNPADTLAGMLLGTPGEPEAAFGSPDEAYTFVNRKKSWETAAAFLAKASPLRTAHLRDPVGPQLHFASEQFMDEVASAIGVDPVQFRLKYLEEPRHRAVIEEAAKAAGWETRPSPKADVSGDVLTGRGIAYAERGATLVAIVAEIEVDRNTGRIWPRRFVVAHDCGLIINPDGLKLALEGNIVQGTSRALFEEVGFDERMVTSVDWFSYPILDIMDAPEKIDVVLINHPEIAPSGAGEATIRPVAAAIANAFFDATGVRLRTAPMSPERVKAALA